MIARPGTIALGMMVAALAMPCSADDPATGQGDRKHVRVVNRVEGSTAILSVVPEGRRVKKGDVICELDSAGLREKLDNHAIAENQSQAELSSAEKTREVAEIALKETVAVLDGEVASAEGEVKLATTALKLAQAKVEGANAGTTNAQLDQWKRALLRAELRLQKAKGNLKLLKDYSKARRLTEAEANLKRARADETAKRAVHEITTGQRKKLEKQIELTRILAPIDGKLFYAPPKADGEPTIEEGAYVRERQLLFRIVPE